jgi:hypothetical protein
MTILLHFLVRLSVSIVREGNVFSSTRGHIWHVFLFVPRFVCSLSVCILKSCICVVDLNYSSISFLILVQNI